MRTSFHEELDGLEQELQAESDLVLRSLRAALASLEHGDRKLADEVIRFDDEVDASYLAIEEGIQNLLARQTPVATSGSCSRSCTRTFISSAAPTIA